MKPTPTKHKTSAKAASGVAMLSEPTPCVEDRPDYIATAAYYRAEARGFVPGQELDDWLEAEAKFDGRKEH
ncbi:MAG: DUF2934 domain-containing protein [Proteobacteria bacterium]|nr:DUF2934 domain-containing protein [Pseudomonadota bacterium]